MQEKKFIQISEQTLREFMIAYAEQVLARVEYVGDLEEVTDEFISEIKEEAK